MASRKKNSDGKAEGFQIPIEDANEAKDEAAPKGAASEEACVEAEVVEAEDVAEEVAKAAADAEMPDDGIVAEAEAILEDLDEQLEAELVAEDAADGLEAARKEASEWQDRYMRLHAEWDTYRRRMSEQREEEKARATEKLVENLLPVLDDFERSIDYAENNGEVGLLEGVRAVQVKLLDALMKSGLEMIDPAGEPFDALEAQAVGTVPDDEVFDETVHDVYQKGYKMGKKVLRPAMVTITTGGPKRPKEGDEDGRQET